MVWACEYSPEQGAFHVDTLERILELNRQTVERGEAPGYIPLAVFCSSEEAHSFAERWRREHPRKEMDTVGG